MPSCYQRGLYKKLAGYDNATTVADWHSPAGADIPPYPRPSGYINGAADPDCGTAGYPLCGPWPLASRPTSATPPQVYHEWNLLDDANEERCVNACVKGHKIVQAKLPFHGQPAMTQCLTGDCDSVGTRYRTIRIQSTTERTDDGGSTVTYSSHYDATFTVNASTGIVTQTACDHAVDENNGPFTDAYALMMVRAQGTLRYDCDQYVGVAFTDGSDSETINASLTMASYLNSPPGGTITIDIDDSGNATYFEAKYTSDNTFGVIQDHYVKVTLSDAYTVASFIAEATDMLSKWSLTNDAVLPWRTDSWRGLGVLMTKHGKMIGVSPDPGVLASNAEEGTPECGWTDPDTTAYTGTNIGDPFTLGLPDGMFSWDHETFHCYDSGGVAWEVSYYGAYSGTEGLTPYTASPLDFTDAVIPTTASNWTDNYLAGVYRPGSWMKYEAGTSLLTMQKQCEVKIAFPAHNYFRPCGSDRWMIDTSIASCVVSISGVDVETGDALTGLTTDDLVVFVDGPNDGKVFEVAAISGVNLTLGDEIVNPAGIADAFTYWQSLKDANRLEPYGVVGKVRYRDAWPICGKVRCSSAQDGGDLTITLSEPAPYLMTGDKVVFVDASLADTILDDNGTAGYEVTVVDSTHFTITATLDADAHNSCVKSLGAPLAKWNTTASRGDFVWQEWPPDAATGTLDTTPINEDDSAKVGKSLGSTPNSDTNSRWITENYNSGYPWPASLALTDCGAEWQVMPIQYMVDPLWQSPFACDTDPVSICAPREEIRTTVPAGAPDLPADASFPIPATPPSGSGWNECGTGPAQVSPVDVPWIPCT